MKIETLFPTSPSLHHVEPPPLEILPEFVFPYSRSSPSSLLPSIRCDMNGGLIVQPHPLPSPLLSSDVSLITSFTSLKKRFSSCGISGGKKMLQGNYIYSECKKEGGRGGD